MQINKVSPVNFNGGILVPAVQKVKNQYLYNQVMDVVKENHVSALFSNKGIDFSSVTDKIINELKNLKIDFIIK